LPGGKRRDLCIADLRCNSRRAQAGWKEGKEQRSFLAQARDDPVARDRITRLYRTRDWVSRVGRECRPGRRGRRCARAALLARTDHAAVVSTAIATGRARCLAVLDGLVPHTKGGTRGFDGARMVFAA